MCFSSWDIIFFVTPGFQESKVVSVGQISKKFELKNPYNNKEGDNKVCVNSFKNIFLQDLKLKIKTSKLMVEIFMISQLMT